jgi:hypothetical protein
LLKKGVKMDIVTHVNTRLIALGLLTTIVNDEIIIQNGSKQTKIRFDQEWEDAFQNYKSIRTATFDSSMRTLQINSSMEIQLQFLSPTFGYNESYCFKDSHKNSVEIKQTSIRFQLALFDSQEYEYYFETRYKNRILGNAFSNIRFVQLIPVFFTATYTHKGRRIPHDLAKIALETTMKCLFCVAVEFGDNFVIYKPRKRVAASRAKRLVAPSVIDIPKPKYDENVVNYYKVAKSSPFSSQSFLSYYHVIEYYFLKVAELKLHDRLAGLINSPTFHTTSDKLGKVISIVRGQDSRSNETEMLRSVLDRYVEEVDLIEFINLTEESCKDKRYTKKRKLFGEDCLITPQKDHG